MMITHKVLEEKEEKKDNYLYIETQSGKLLRACAKILSLYSAFCVYNRETQLITKRSRFLKP